MQSHTNDYTAVLRPNVDNNSGHVLQTLSTHSTSGTLTVWLPSNDMTEAGVVGVASIRASTASAPIRHA